VAFDGTRGVARDVTKNPDMRAQLCEPRRWTHVSLIALTLRELELHYTET
jgi:hypothetical protein